VNGDFDVLARPLIGRVADIGLKLKPMLMIVSNESPQTVVSYSKTWTARYADGRTSAIRSHTSFPEAVCGDMLAPVRSKAVRIEWKANDIVAVRQTRWVLDFSIHVANEQATLRLTDFPDAIAQATQIVGCLFAQTHRFRNRA
jgi:hypothetical protein